MPWTNPGKSEKSSVVVAVVLCISFLDDVLIQHLMFCIRSGELAVVIDLTE